MATYDITFSSGCLQRQVHFKMVIPNDAPSFITDNNPNYDRPMKTCYLLHGFSENEDVWLYGSPVWDLSSKYNIAFVMPSCDNRFYLDGEASGTEYAKYVGEELVNYTRKQFNLSDRREDTFIGGLSMGGFGAIHTGLLYNHTFGKIIAFSSALIHREVMGMTPGFANEIANYEYYRQIFGEPKDLPTSENNPEFLYQKRKAANEPIAPIYMAIGTEDFLYNANQDFLNFLKEEGADVTYTEGPGNHNWEFWGKNIEPALCWALEIPQP